MWDKNFPETPKEDLLADPLIIGQCKLYAAKINAGDMTDILKTFDIFKPVIISEEPYEDYIESGKEESNTPSESKEPITKKRKVRSYSKRLITTTPQLFLILAPEYTPLEEFNGGDYRIRLLKRKAIGGGYVLEPLNDKHKATAAKHVVLLSLKELHSGSSSDYEYFINSLLNRSKISEE